MKNVLTLGRKLENGIEKVVAIIRGNELLTSSFNKRMLNNNDLVVETVIKDGKQVSANIVKIEVTANKNTYSKRVTFADLNYANPLAFAKLVLLGDLINNKNI